MYLRDTRVIQYAHHEALRASAREILNLLATQPTDMIQNALMSEGTVDADTGEYHDDMNQN